MEVGCLLYGLHGSHHILFTIFRRFSNDDYTRKFLALKQKHGLI
jgi:hypothetical protein